MAVNPNIPLGVQNVNLSSPLANLINTRNMQEDRRIMREREARAARQEQRQAEQFDLSSQQARQNIQQNEAQLRQMMQSEATRNYVTDAMTVRNLLSNEDAQNAALVVQSMREKYQGTPYASGLDEDLQNLQAGNIAPVMDSFTQELNTIQQVQQFLGGGGQRQSATTDLGKLRQDLEAGFITPEQYQTSVQQLSGQGQPTEKDQIELETARARLGQIEASTEATEQKAATEAQEETERQRMIGNEMLRAYDLASSLLDNPALQSAVGPVQGRLPAISEGKADVRADLDELGNLLTIGNLGRMSGVLSESDIRLLANAASGLSDVASDERAVQKLQEIKRRIESNPRFGELTQQTSTQSVNDPLGIL